jgi:hypothetical protein
MRSRSIDSKASKCRLTATIINTLIYAGWASITIGGLSGWFVIGGAASTMAAQQLERPQELRLPGSDVTLRVDWQLRFHDGCHFAVPASWPPSVDRGLIRSRDGALTLVVAAVPLATWSGHKTQILSQMHGAVVQEDTDTRFRLQVDNGHRIFEYMAVRDGAIACTGQIEVDVASAARFKETTDRILESVGPSASLWRALLK